MSTDQTAVAEPMLRRLADLPSPKGLPLIGNALDIVPHLFHQKLEQWSREFGAYFVVKLGARRLLVISDHQVIAKNLRERPDGFDRTQRLAETWKDMGLQVGVFGANGEVWKKMRRMAMSAFDPAHVKAYFPAMIKVTDRLESRWKKSLGSDIDLQADLMRFTVDTITGLAFGHDVNTLESGDDIIQSHLDKIFPAVHKRNLAVFRYWRYFRLPSDRALDRSVAEVNAAIDRFVAQGRERLRQHPELRQHPSNLLEAMINAADQGDSGLNDNDVAGNVLTMLLAGEDTTANSLAWLLSLLWANPSTLATLQQELRSKLDGETSYSIDKLNDLDYLDACINESMRLKPVAPMIPLQTLKEMVIGDVEVPPGTLVFNLMRRDSVEDSHIPNAAQFDPQRWLSTSEAAQTAGQAISSVKRISMPFGAGPRICPGRYLALLEMKIAMAMLLTRFDIDSITAPNGKEPEEHMAFTMAPVGLKMRLKLRK